MFVVAKAKIDQAINSCQRIVYCDECVFTHTAVQNTAYSASRVKTQIPDQQVRFAKFNLVAAIFYEYGVEAVYITQSTVDSDEFVKIIPMCRAIG